MAARYKNHIGTGEIGSYIERFLYQEVPNPGIKRHRLVSYWLIMHVSGILSNKVGDFRLTYQFVQADHFVGVTSALDRAPFGCSVAATKRRTSNNCDFKAFNETN